MFFFFDCLLCKQESLSDNFIQRTCEYFHGTCKLNWIHSDWINSGACKRSHQRGISWGWWTFNCDTTCDLFSTGVASRKSKVTCTSNRLTQAHWHRPWMALFRWSGLVVCKSTRENSDTVFLVSFRRLQEALATVGSKRSLFMFIVPKCSQLNKIDRNA